MRIKTLLVPLDYSDHSLNALRIAISLVQQFDAKLIIMHSHDVPASSSMSHYRGLLASMSNSVKEGLLEELKMVTSLFKELGTLDVEYKVTLGPAVYDIRQIASAYCADLIVMGTLGRSNSLKQRFGSVSSKLAVAAPCSVLIIPNECEDLHLKSIVLATDYHLEEELGDLAVLRALSLKANSEVTILNVSETVGVLDKQEKEEAFEIHQYLDDVKHKFCHVDGIDVNEGLTKYARAYAAGLIAVTPTKHDFLNRILHLSHTEQLAMESKIPLLAIHD